MIPFTIFIQALGVALSTGINVPATVALLGLMQRAAWIGPLPGGLDVLGAWWIIGLALTLAVVEFVVTLVPGVASVWETVQSVVRPPAAVVLAVATTYHLEPAYMIAAALIGGTLAFTAHGAKLGVRYAVDTSPEPVTNFAANATELAAITSLCLSIWHHPYLTMTIAVTVLVLVLLLVRRIIRAFRRGLGQQNDAV